MLVRTPLTPTGPTSRPQLYRAGASRPGWTDELLHEASQRLQVNALVATALWTLSFVLETFVFPAVYVYDDRAERVLRYR